MILFNCDWGESLWGYALRIAYPGIGIESSIDL